MSVKDRVPAGDRVILTMYAWHLVDGSSCVDFGDLGIKELSTRGIALARMLIATNPDAAAFFEEKRRNALAGVHRHRA